MNYKVLSQPIISLLILMLFSITSCNKEGIDDSGEVTYEKEDTTPEAPEYINKKGLGLSIDSREWSYRLSDSKVFWHYSWGNFLPDNLPDSVEFVPMIWGKNGINANKVAELQQLKDEGKIEYLLGFNEPDHASQSNMTVEEAIERWPLLEDVGVKLGSPACVHADGDWMVDFMAKAEQMGLRVDFVTVHWYGRTNATAFLDKIKEVHEMFGKPIWITEFACADWNATTVEENVMDAADVLSFMKEVLPALEKMEFLERYAWFPGSIESAALTSSALWDMEGNLTPLGEYYAGFMPNTSIGEGKGELHDDSVWDDNFEDYAVDTNLGAQGYVVWEGSANVFSGDAYEGAQYGQSDASKVNFDFRKTFMLEEGKTYELSVATKIEDGKKHLIRILPKDVYQSQWIEAYNTDWENHTTQFTVEESSEEVTISIYRYPKIVLSFDAIKLTVVE